MQAGIYNTLSVVRKTKEGIILSDGSEEAILFRRELKEDLNEGDEVRAFVFSDSEHPFIATLHKPNIQLNEFALLEVKSVNQFGAFLDWGIAKDLFVPFAEQKIPMEEGRSYIVYLYEDPIKKRLTGSSRINKFLSKDIPDVDEKDSVDIIISGKSPLGFNVIINNKFAGLLYTSEIIRPVRIGDKMKAYIKAVREDNKIDVRLRRPGHHEVNDSEEKILQHLQRNDGFLHLNDDSDPEEIRELLHMSKKTFKKAIGSLYKQRLIRLAEDGIYLSE